jgi:hypothetical protein
MFLIMNTALGGTGGGTINNATLPQTSSFDYAHITTANSPTPTPSPTATPTPTPTATPTPTGTPNPTATPTPNPTGTPYPSPAGGYLYGDTFAGDATGTIPAGWTVGGANAGFTVASNGQHVYRHQGWSATTAAGNTAWTNYSVNVDVKPSAWQSEVNGVDVRYTDAKDFYSVRFIGAREISFGRMGNDGSWSGRWTPLASAQIAYGSSWHHVTITASGSHFTVSLDGAPLMSADDATFSHGSIGFDANAPVDYGTISVNGL